jgi:anti-anti-sigma factor
MQYKINKEEEEDITFVQITGDVDRGKDCLELSRKTGEILDAGRTHLVIDLTSTDFVSSAFCGIISSLVKKAKQNESRFSIILNTASLTYEIFNIAGVNQIVDTYPSTEAFMRILGNQKA